MATNALPIAVQTPNTSRGGLPRNIGCGSGHAANLPAWAEATTPRVLLSAIILEKPEQRIGDACGFKVIEYRGANAAKLRRYFDGLKDTALAADDAAFYEGRQSDEFAQLMRETPDALIGRLLREGVVQ